MLRQRFNTTVRQAASGSTRKADRVAASALAAAASRWLLRAAPLPVEDSRWAVGTHISSV